MPELLHLGFLVKQLETGHKNICQYSLAPLLLGQVLLEQVSRSVRGVFRPLVSACQPCHLLGFKYLLVLGRGLTVDVVQHISAVQRRRRTIPWRAIWTLTTSNISHSSAALHILGSLLLTTSLGSLPKGRFCAPLFPIFSSLSFSLKSQNKTLLYLSSSLVFCFYT